MSPLLLAQRVSTAALHCYRTLLGLSQTPYATRIRRTENVQHLLQACRVCLQRSEDAEAYNVCSQIDPSNSATRKVAGQFDWNLVCSALSGCLWLNTIGSLCCNLSRTRCNLFAAKFGTGFTASLNRSPVLACTSTHAVESRAFSAFNCIYYNMRLVQSSATTFHKIKVRWALFPLAAI